MVAARAIEDSSYLWWAIRPSQKYPTLELRVADSCTSVGHACASPCCSVACAAAGAGCGAQRHVSAVSRAIACENKWRAQRYGIHGSFVDEARQRQIT